MPNESQIPAQQDATKLNSGTPQSTQATSPFVSHLQYASSIVNRWPAWKQAILGGTVNPPTTGTSNLPRQ
jgi:hypothetical protein